jgi:RNA polymerase sigma factor (sigma-70 family)
MRRRGRSPTPAAGSASAAWTKAELDRLIAGEGAAWDKLIGVIDGLADAARCVWKLSTLEADVVRDYTQDVFLSGRCRRLREFRDPRRFNAYLVKILRNRAREVARGRSKVSAHPLGDDARRTVLRVADHRPSISVPFETEQGRGRTELAARLLGARRALSARQFQVLWLCHVEGFSMTRVAAALGISRQAVGKTHDLAISAVRRRRAGDGAANTT